MIIHECNRGGVRVMHLQRNEECPRCGFNKQSKPPFQHLTIPCIHAIRRNGKCVHCGDESSDTIVVPDGWKLVPKQPTDEMALAACRVNRGNPAINGVPAYLAMLAAAPQHYREPSKCTRSHPHELMSPECEALTVKAREDNRVANIEADRMRLQEAMAMMVGSNTLAELQALETEIKKMPAPFSDKSAMLNGVRALIQSIQLTGV